MNASNMTGYGIPIEKHDIDTDQIIPARFCYSGKLEGYENALFGDWRQDSGFFLNSPKYKRATIMVVGGSFATGSSREYAVWAIRDYGFKVVIAESFGEIFKKNAIINNILVLEANALEIKKLWKILMEMPNEKININLNENELLVSDIKLRINIEEKIKKKYLLGLDDIELTMTKMKKVKKFEDVKYPELIKKRLKGLRNEKSA